MDSSQVAMRPCVLRKDPQPLLVGYHNMDIVNTCIVVTLSYGYYQTGRVIRTIRMATMLSSVSYGF